MLSPGTLINRIVPVLLAGAPGEPPSVAVLLLALAGLGVIGAAFWSASRRRRRRRAIADRARERGLSTESADFLGRLMERDSPDGLDALLAMPELLRRRLAGALRDARDDDAATRLAALAARVCAEHQPRRPFPGAPAIFAALRLHAPSDPGTMSVLAWVLAVDERRLVLVSRAECPWPARRALRLLPDGVPRPDEFIDAQLLIRPAFPLHEWTLTHRLVDVVTDHRSLMRVPCRLPADILPDDADAPALRDTLHRERPWDEDALRTSAAWARRHEATVMDISAEGARLLLRHEVSPRQRFHVLLRRPDGRVAALPLAEVVAAGPDAEGAWRVGVRFVTLRMKERLRISEFVRELVRERAAAPKA